MRSLPDASRLSAKPIISQPTKEMGNINKIDIFLPSLSAMNPSVRLDQRDRPRVKCTLIAFT